jgi:hypothetical protein
MNAPAKIAPARDRYRMIVRHHCPAAEGDDLTLRCSLLLIRDKAASALRHCSEEAAGILIEVQRLASTYAFASIPTAELADLRRRLVLLTSCASGLEGFAHRIGERHAGGR